METIIAKHETSRTRECNPWLPIFDKKKKKTVQFASRDHLVIYRCDAWTRRYIGTE